MHAFDVTTGKHADYCNCRRSASPVMVTVPEHLLNALLDSTLADGTNRSGIGNLLRLQAAARAGLIDFLEGQR